MLAAKYHGYFSIQYLLTKGAIEYNDSIHLEALFKKPSNHMGHILPGFSVASTNMALQVESGRDLILRGQVGDGVK